MSFNKLITRWRNRLARPGSLRATQARAHATIGEERINRGDARGAIEPLRRAVELEPADPARWYWLGVAHLESDQLAQAADCFCRTLQMDAGHARAHNNAGVVRQLLGDAERALGHFRDAVRADPRLAQARYNLGRLLLERGDLAQAIDQLREAVTLEPRQATWLAVLGSALNLASRPLEARAALEAALRLDAASADANEELAGCLLDMGEADAAVESFRRARALDPSRQSLRSSLLLALNYSPTLSPEAIHREHLEVARTCVPASATPRFTNGVDPERRLRVGYVSPDLRDHSMQFFIEPVLAAHDRAAVEVYCYSDVRAEDAVTARLKPLADHWRASASLANGDLAAAIRNDAIDILVDLAGHSAGGARMALFAERAAPLQMSWLGYLNTSGLAAMDYRITDWISSPAGTERLHTERLIRLRHSQWCYLPPRAAPDVGPLPAARAGAVTFGSCHNLAKVTSRVSALWSRLLQAVRGARLVMLAPGLDQLAPYVAARFRAHGVDPARIEFLRQRPLDGYLALHHRIDVNLDAFPYSGATTTLHSLWMGVPLLTLQGPTLVGRNAASILATAGLPEFIAGSEEAYLEKAVGLAADIPRLASLRHELRATVARSPLTDSKTFVQDLESAYRQAWRDWCKAAAARA